MEFFGLVPVHHMTLGLGSKASYDSRVSPFANSNIDKATQAPCVCLPRGGHKEARRARACLAAAAPERPLCAGRSMELTLARHGTASSSCACPVPRCCPSVTSVPFCALPQSKRACGLSQMRSAPGGIHVVEHDGALATREEEDAENGTRALPAAQRRAQGRG